MGSRFLKSTFMVSFISVKTVTDEILEDIISSPLTASVVRKINGIDASKYVQDFVYAASFHQDADAGYNSMFFTKELFASGQGKGYFSRGGRIRYV
jgi:hypothetical protein